MPLYEAFATRQASEPGCKVLAIAGSTARLEDVMLTVIGSGVGKVAATTLAKKFGRAVIERWTKHRAQEFFYGFVETLTNELTSGMQSVQVDVLLTDMLADEQKSEILFDAYRRVCFTTSKRLGPRIIGLLTGELIRDGSMASESQQQIFAAAEALSDGEFIEFFKEYHYHRTKADGVSDVKAKHRLIGGAVHVRWSEDGGMGRARDMDIGSFPWREAFGQWAIKLNHAGLMSDRIQQSILHEPRGRSSDDDRVATNIVTTVTFEQGCSELSRLLVRAIPPEELK